MSLLKGSVESKIYNRFKKLQRKRSDTPVATHAPKPKGKAKKSKKTLCWTTVPESQETEEDLSVAVSNIKKEWQRARKDHSKIQELMAACYPKRRSLIIEDVNRIVDVVDMFPPLTNLLYVSSSLMNIINILVRPIAYERMLYILLYRSRPNLSRSWGVRIYQDK